MVKKTALTINSVPPIKYVDAYTKFQYIFFDRPCLEAGLNEIHTLAQVSKTSANTAVNRLAKEGFLKVKKIGRTWLISCNQKHPYNITRKVSYHLWAVFESEVIGAVRKAVPDSRTIILFGSYRKGDDIETSDMDLAVEVVGHKQLSVLELGRIQQLGYRNNVPVNLHIFSRENISLNLFANIANGIVLDGFLEVRP